MKEKIAENAGKIKQNKVLPYLVGNVVEVSVWGVGWLSVCLFCVGVSSQLCVGIGGVTLNEEEGGESCGSCEVRWEVEGRGCRVVHVDLGNNWRFCPRKADREDCLGGGISPACS